MRDLRSLALPHGGFSPTRKFFSLVLATIMALFAVLAVPASISAQSAPNSAEWKGEAIIYNQNQYVGITIPTNPDGSSAIPNLPADAKAFASIDPAGPGLAGTPQKAHIIYFAPGTDPPTATTANLVTYDYLPPASYSNPTGGTTIGITPQSSSTKTVTSCDSGEFLQGIGWIVCPATKFLAGAMDWLFKILSDFLTVRPVQTSQDNALFKAWSIMRNFANVMFIIGFLVVIYSQVTSIGLSNYSLKKIFPRLLIAAILVNISYWICAVAIDASNILGHSIQDLFIAIRNGLVGAEGNSWDLGFTWKNVAGFVLSGGAALTGGAIAAYAIAAGSVGGAIYMLLPILVGVLLAALIAILVMAARQALITVLVVISPLAFVAYLLPNTDKYFKKWRELFTTMLVLFPIFSLIFGGAQLAGVLIIQNADSINLIILGMGVQVAPVVVTPLLVKFSGSLVGRVAGVVNNPNKGLIDRTRNWAREQSEEHRARVLGNTAPSGIRGYTMRRTQNIDHRRRRGKAWKEANEGFAEARWANSADYREIHGARDRANMIKETGEALAQAHVNQLKMVPGNQMQVDEVNLRVAKARADLTKAQTDVQWENLRAAESPLNVIPQQLATQALYARAMARDSMVTQRQLHNAQHEQTQDFSRALLADQALQRQAGGISEHGADSALAAAVTATRKAYGDSITEAAQIVKHFNLDSSQRQRHARGEEFSVSDGDGNVRVFRSADVFTREAVIDQQVRQGTLQQAQELIELSGSTLRDFRTTIRDAAAEAGIGAKAPYITGGVFNSIGRGDVLSPAHFTGYIQNAIADGKISADKLVGADKDALANILRAATASTQHMDQALAPKLPSAVQTLKQQADLALTDPRLSPRLADNQRTVLRDITNLP